MASEVAWLVGGAALTVLLVVCVLYWAWQETLTLRARRQEIERLRREEAASHAQQPEGDALDQNH